MRLAIQRSIDDFDLDFFNEVTKESRVADTQNATRMPLDASAIPGSKEFSATMAQRCRPKHNPWGSVSYSELITQAISSVDGKRLTLGQIYEWIIDRVQYFHERSDNASSAGWKNCIRHNLCLHNRFLRVQKEGIGRSSWWMVNPAWSSKRPLKELGTKLLRQSATLLPILVPLQKDTHRFSPLTKESSGTGVNISNTPYPDVHVVMADPFWDYLFPKECSLPQTPFSPSNTASKDYSSCNHA